MKKTTKLITQVEDISTYFLLIELMHEGNSGIVQEIEHLEPIDVHKILAVLQGRSDKDLGCDYRTWLDWFLQSEGHLTDAQKTTLIKLESMKSVHDHIVKNHRHP